MTFDFQLGQTCPHLTIEEQVALGSDRMSLVTRQPVASATLARISANNIDIPPSGLQSAARIVGSSSGPFRILSYATDLTLQTRQGSKTFAVPAGNRVPSSEVQSALMSQGGQGIQVDSSGHMVFQNTIDKGPSSWIKVTGGAAEALGFAGQVRARGKNVYPGWAYAEQEVVLPRPNISGRLSARYPKFLSPIHQNPVFKATYATFQQTCLRCLSYGVENDYRVGTDGEYRTVVDDNKLNQDSIKILTTIRGSNPYIQDYGSLLLTRIGIKAVGSGAATITEDVTKALTTLQKMQQIWGRYLPMSLKERLQSILSITVTPSPLDPTVFRVRIVVSNASSDPIVITTVYTAPQAAALAGTNGLSLGLAERGVNPSLRSLGGF